MNEISVYNTNLGIADVIRQETDRVKLPGSRDTAGMHGGKVKQTMRTLYDQATTRDVALDLTIPDMSDQELSLSHKFDLALHILHEKMEAGEAHIAVEHVRNLKQTRDRYGINFLALNMA